MMPEYIKCHDVMKICQQYSQHCFNVNDAKGQDVADRIEDDVVKLPTADVVEVVRCKDCEHLTVHNSPTLYAYCEKTQLRFEPFKTDTRTHFCSYGKMKGGAEE